jgi:hypothetical protein
MRNQPPSVALLAAGLLLAAAPSSSERDCCPVLELRQYTLKPGQRNVLIELFDRHFVESQEATGMTIVGQFRDLRRADRFVWVRGFADMQTRHRALEAFYGGPVWAEHKAAANATMVDVSDVCLLKPAGPETSFHLDITDRPKPGEVRGSAIVAVGIHRLQQAADAGVLSQFQQHVVPALRRERVFIQSVFVTESAPNTFARLPVREGEHLLVWFGTAQNGEPPTEPRLLAATAGLSAHADGPASFLELEPTPRSLLGRHKGP